MKSKTEMPFRVDALEKSEGTAGEGKEKSRRARCKEKKGKRTPFRTEGDEGAVFLRPEKNRKSLEEGGEGKGLRIGT